MSESLGRNFGNINYKNFDKQNDNNNPKFNRFLLFFVLLIISILFAISL